MGATCLFNAGVAEKVIQKTTGHHSIDGYERVSMEQQQASTKVLTSINPNVTYTLDSQNTWIAGIHLLQLVSCLPSRVALLAALPSICSKPCPIINEF